MRFDNGFSTALIIILGATSTGAIAAAPKSTSIDDQPWAADRTVIRTAPAVMPTMAGGMTTPDPGDVGDADSFGRNLHWLGLADAEVDLVNDCTGYPAGCQVLSPVPTVTSFSFDDLGHITLPARAANSLLCYWFSPFLTINYGNDGSASVVADLDYVPTVTIDNPVLDDPSLIDPSTGMPFNGHLLTAMTSSQQFEIPLPAATHVTERKRDSSVCIAGLISRSTLVQDFGLSDSQARDFFRQPMTLHLNVEGHGQYVDSAFLYFGWRIVGD